MPREKSNNYDAKRDVIMDKAARLFSEKGYPSTRMIDIALACNASKSMLYHYFVKKEDILHAILKEHLEELIRDTTQLRDESPQYTGDALIRAFVDLFVQKSTKARTRHLVAVLDVKYLPKKQQISIRTMEKEIITLTSNILKYANPNLSEHEYNPYALLIIGMINSMDIWRKPGGLYSASEMANILSNLVLDGFLNTKQLEAKTPAKKDRPVEYLTPPPDAQLS